MALDGHALGARVVRRRRARVRARARGRLLPAGRQPARVPQRRRRDRARDLRVAPSYAAVTRRGRRRRRRDEDRRRARRRRARARSSRARRIPTGARSAAADAVLADCRALAAELGDGAAAAGTRRLRAGRPGRARAQRARRSTGATPTCSATFDGGRVRRARGGARRGALRRRARRARLPLRQRRLGDQPLPGRPAASRALGVRGSAIGTGAPLVERWSSGLALARRTRARVGARRRSPIPPPPRWSRTPRGGSAWRSRRSSTRSTPAR